MIPHKILKKVRKIEIHTRGLVNNLFGGEYHSAFKGRGMTFSEVREYQPGDDIRLIDWNVTARMGYPHVKEFREERELTVLLAVDVSASMNLGQKNTIQVRQVRRALVGAEGGRREVRPVAGRAHRLREALPPAADGAGAQQTAAPQELGVDPAAR